MNQVAREPLTCWVFNLGIGAPGERNPLPFPRPQRGPDLHSHSLRVALTGYGRGRLLAATVQRRHHMGLETREAPETKSALQVRSSGLGLGMAASKHGVSRQGPNSCREGREWGWVWSRLSERSTCASWVTELLSSALPSCHHLLIPLGIMAWRLGKRLELSQG